MNEYKELLAELRKCKYCARDTAKYAADAIEQLVTAVHADPVVRCKDCIHSYDDLCGLCCTCGPCVDCIVQPDFYCAEGKRKRGTRGVE